MGDRSSYELAAESGGADVVDEADCSANQMFHQPIILHCLDLLPLSLLQS